MWGGGGGGGGGSRPTAKAMHRIIHSSALPRFWTPDLSVIETTHLDR